MRIVTGLVELFGWPEHVHIKCFTEYPTVASTLKSPWIRVPAFQRRTKQRLTAHPNFVLYGERGLLAYPTSCSPCSRRPTGPTYRR
jgi:hypothetical protein